jgi:hypothetical protein
MGVVYKAEDPKLGSASSLFDRAEITLREALVTRASQLNQFVSADFNELSG